MMPASPALILLHPSDNVLVACRTITAGESLTVEGVAKIAEQPITLGHKIARYDLTSGDKVIRYGAPIGSMTAPARMGEHVHLHNLKSDYIPSHTREAVHVAGEHK